MVMSYVDSSSSGFLMLFSSKLISIISLGGKSLEVASYSTSSVLIVIVYCLSKLPNKSFPWYKPSEIYSSVSELPSLSETTTVAFFSTMAGSASK